MSLKLQESSQIELSPSSLALLISFFSLQLFMNSNSSKRFIRLNVYYLTPYRSLHALFNLITLGLLTPYHSAIEIDNFEYAYYGHPFSFSGIMFEKSNHTLMILAYTKIYGETCLSDSEIENLAHRLAFHGTDYNLLKFNCNTFTDAFLYALTKHRLPAWINRTERCLRRIKCIQRFFNENEDISMRIVNALYMRSAGDQTTVFKLLEIDKNDTLMIIYEVMLQDLISCGKLPNFLSLHQSTDPHIRQYLQNLQEKFLFTFSNKNSLTLNKIFADLPSLHRQLVRLEKYSFEKSEHKKQANIYDRFSIERTSLKIH